MSKIHMWPGLRGPCPEIRFPVDTNVSRSARRPAGGTRFRFARILVP